MASQPDPDLDYFSRLDADCVGAERAPESPAQQTSTAAPDPWWMDFYVVYVIGAFVFGWIAAIVTFGVYVAAVASVGWVIGLALGWIPVGIAAAIAGILLVSCGQCSPLAARSPCISW